MLNRTTLVGRLVRDPELRYTQSGVPVATMTVAVDRNFANRQGDREADFLDVVVWRKLAETCSNYLAKGRLVAVDGSLRSRRWEKDGVKRKTVEILADSISFLDRAKPGDQVRHQADGDPPLDDEVPF